MKRLALAFVLPLLTVFLVAPAHAASTPSSPMRSQLRERIYKTFGSIAVPPEWAGIWLVTDSTFDCNGVFQDVTTETDTLCAGMLVYDPPTDVEIVINCTGTADGNEIHALCTGSTFFDPCTVDYSFSTDGTRTADAWDIRTETSFIASGDPLCSLFNNCFRSHSIGQRTGPEPSAYCATPAHDETWGRLKSRYR
jgi:hypothetical protein